MALASPRMLGAKGWMDRCRMVISFWRPHSSSTGVNQEETDSFLERDETHPWEAGRTLRPSEESTLPRLRSTEEHSPTQRGRRQESRASISPSGMLTSSQLSRAEHMAHTVLDEEKALRVQS